MKLIHGPEDVAVGDLVQFEVGNHRRRGHMEGCVTAVHDESVSVRVEGDPREGRGWKQELVRSAIAALQEAAKS